jgi:DNA-binding transcriptional LysR family regulator
MVFVRVVEAGSFVAAARQTDIPKSTIARRIEELEGHLGVRLLQRSTRKSELTDAGRSFYQRCRQIVEDVDDAVASVSEHQREPRGTLRFTTSVLLAETYLGNWIVDYLEKHPQVEFDISLTARNADLIADGFDLALRVGPLESSSYIVRRLAPAPSFICASPRYLESHPAPESIEDLSRHQAIIFSPTRSRTPWELENAEGDRTSVSVRGRMIVNSHPVALQACLGGLGLAELPALVGCEALRSGELVRVLPKWSNASRWLHALYPSRHHLSPTVRTFLDFLTERLSPAPWASI